MRNFSPDFATVAAGNSYSDGFGDGVFAFLDAADGAVESEFVAGDDFAVVSDAVWEDDDSALLVLASTSSESNTVVRVNTDGTAELAADGPGEVIVGK